MPRPDFANRRPSLSVVVPVLDEQEVIAPLVDRLSAVLDNLEINAEVILVDDGSTDGTPTAIALAHRRDPRFVGLSLSRNFGHQVAISAGLAHARGSAVVVMDGDLQDPPEAIPALLDRLRDGFDVVYAIRASRPEGLLKRIAYAAFYRLLRRSVAIDIPLDAGDFGILSRRAVDAINAMPERRRFLRGMRAWVGFRQVGIAIDRAPRLAGTPKYTLRKLAGLALDGFIGFGEAPIRWAAVPGSLGISSGLVGFLGIAARALMTGRSPSTAEAILVLGLFFGGAQLLAMAILGEYVGRILGEVNGRPLYLVRRRIGLASPGRRRKADRNIENPSRSIP